LSCYYLWYRPCNGDSPSKHYNDSTQQEYADESLQHGNSRRRSQQMIVKERELWKRLLTMQMILNKQKRGVGWRGRRKDSGKECCEAFQPHRVGEKGCVEMWLTSTSWTSPCSAAPGRHYRRQRRHPSNCQHPLRLRGRLQSRMRNRNRI
jgi:hypothetical protein